MKLYAFASALMLLGLGAAHATAQDQPGLAELSGAWRMVSLQVDGAEVPYSGQVVFTEAGTMSVQAMNPDAEAPDGPYTIQGYEAFFGNVVVDAEQGTFVVSIESSAVRELIGQDAERAFEIVDEQLILTPTNPEETWRVAYERY